jgi:hypothetical protein
VIGRSKLDLALERANSVGKAVANAVREGLARAPESTHRALGFAKRAAGELFGIAKEKAPGVADQALGAARERLGRVLPFARREKAAEYDAVPVAAE